jgi:PAS domain S-box-containing protein
MLQELAYVQIYLGVSAIVMLLVAAVVSERDRSEELRQSQEQFVAMAEASPDLLWTFSPTGAAVYANPRMLRCFGIGLEGLGTDAWKRSLHPDDRERVGRDWGVAFERGEVFDAEFRMRCAPDRHYRWFHYRAIPFLGVEGASHLWQGVFNDIHDSKTEAERLELLVHQRTAALQQTNQDLERFSYSVSHDLRSPLRAIVSSARILKEDYREGLPEGAQELLERHADSALRMARLIDDLLHFSRLGRAAMEIEKIDLSQMAHSVLAEVAEGQDVELVVEDRLTATGDAKLMRIVLQNLFDNALKYRRPGSPAVIHFGMDPSKQAFFVRDEGIGFGSEYVERVFEPFERLHPGDKISGTGIGLANVRQGIERHGGRVWAESEPGKGATFYFQLPPPAASSAK